MPTAENSDNAPKGSPLGSQPEWFPRVRQGFVLAVILGGTPAFTADPDNGERLAQARCVPCHIVKPDQPSQVADAPPFEVIARKFGPNRDTLAFSLLDPHPRMNLTLTRREAQDIAAYISTLAK